MRALRAIHGGISGIYQILTAGVTITQGGCSDAHPYVADCPSST
jgi:hypothetical protein